MYLKLHPTVEKIQQLWPYLDFVLAGFIFLLPFFFSLPLLSDDLWSGEAAEFLLGAKSLGIVHFSGYPLYLLVTKCFLILIPWASEIWCMSFASLIFGCGTAWIIYLSGQRLHFPTGVSFIAALTLFFSPFHWQAAVLPFPYTFHLLLIASTVYLTWEILEFKSTFPWYLKLILWAWLCGAASMQHPSLLAWSLVAFGVGLILGLPHQHAKAPAYLLALVGFLFGVVLPYLYFPWRLFSPQAFLNPDYMFPSMFFSRTFSWEQWLTWSANYFGSGFRAWVHPWGMTSFWREIGKMAETFLQEYPFLLLAIIIWGLWLNARKLFLRLPPARSSLEPNPQQRLVAVWLPGLALLGTVLLSWHSPQTIWLTLSLSMTYWSWEGLNYCYSQLGQVNSPALALAQRPRPSWFGLLILCLVLGLTILQTQRTLIRQVHHAQAPHSLLAQCRTFLKALPPDAILVFPQSVWSFPLSYVQQVTGLRPDILLAPFSQPWAPTMENVSPHKFPDPANLVYMQAWIQGLSQARLRRGPAYSLFQPMSLLPGLSLFTQNFELQQAFPPLLWSQERKPKERLSVYAILPQALAAQPISPPATRKTIGVFKQKYRLFADPQTMDRKYFPPFALLSFNSTWQILPPVRSEQLWIMIWISPAEKPAWLTMLDGSQHSWKVLRAFGYGYPWHKLPPYTFFRETYQIPVTAQLPVGKYIIYLALFDAITQQLLPAQGISPPASYFLPVAEFEVLASQPSVSSSGARYHFPNCVPLK